MAVLSELPQELFDLIFPLLSRDDFRSLRLTSRATNDASTSALFKDAHLSLNPSSWNNLQEISNASHLYRHVRALHFRPVAWPEFKNQTEFAHQIDMRPFIGHYFRQRSLETGEHTHTIAGSMVDLNASFYEAYKKLQIVPWELEPVYSEYQNLVKSHEAFLRSLLDQKSLPALLRRLPLLASVRIKQWYEDWYRSPRRQSDGTISAYEKFAFWFKRKDFAVHPQEREVARVVDGSLAIRDWHVHQQRLMTALLLPVFTRQAQHDGFVELKTLDLRLDLDNSAFTTSQRDMNAYIERRGVFDRYHPCVADDLRAANIGGLTKLHVDLELGEFAGGNHGVEEALSMLLRTADTLEIFKFVLRYSWRHGNNSHQDCMRYLSGVEMRRLQNFEFHGVRAYTTQQSLTSFLTKQRSHLKRIRLAALGLTSGSWKELVRSIPEFMSLEHFEARDLTSLSPEGYQLHFLPSSPKDHFKLLASQVEAYVTGRGPWPDVDAPRSSGPVNYATHANNMRQNDMLARRLEQAERSMEAWDE